MTTQADRQRDPSSQPSRPGHAAGAGHLQCRHHAFEADHGGARHHLDDKSKSFAATSGRLGAVHAEELDRNSEMVLRRNPHYWKPGSDGKPLPYLDKIRYPDHS